ncbi:MAG: glutaminyl-peptide cyclotransferase [Maricaulis sp.]|jgi:glutaminyl-peptide cyclotransferase|nr:glutaminyl-peptide cyclotransferase [Maricaulis sp.]MDG2045509.1 glutaminyl-peptide cyclotransferase [Maricaulis sp.]
MKSLSSALAALALLPLSACSQEAAFDQHAEIVATYPHDARAFTQGLFIHEGVLYESTGQVGESSLRRVDLETGRVEAQVDIPRPIFGEGSAQVGDEIFVLSWQAERGFIYNAATLEQVDGFNYPGEGWGLTYDGRHLILSDGTPEIRFINPESMEWDHSIEVTYNGRPMNNLNELEWINGEIWANIWMTRSIARINPRSGEVVGIIALDTLIPSEVLGRRDAVANGIAYNAQTGQIYVTGKLWPALYEIRIVDD